MCSQEIVIAGAHSDAAADPLALPEPGAGDMRFHLPASPSCAVLQYIMAGCQEVKRAGDHRIGELQM